MPTGIYARKPFSEEHRKSLSKSKLSKPNRYWLGKKRPDMFTEEVKQKISKSNKGILGGHKNPNWKGGGERYLSRIAKERDEGTCQMCGLKEIDIMVVDHIIPKSIRPDIRYSLDNLMTLCPNCHARKTKIDVKTIALAKRETITKLK